MHVYLRAKFERHRRGLNLRQLAAITGMSATDLSRIERGMLRPTSGQLVRIADALLISPPGILLRPVKIADPEPEAETSEVGWL